MNVLLLGPQNNAHRTVKVGGGRSYTAGAGQPLSVPDFDAGPLTANGWIRVALSGTTAQRPLVPVENFYYDTTLSKLVVWDTVTWRDPATGNAV